MKSSVNIRDTSETKEDQVLRRVRFVDLRRIAGLLRRLSCIVHTFTFDWIVQLTSHFTF